METILSWSDPKLAASLAAGKIAVMPTDTIYGIVCPAGDAALVERMYEIRKRAPEKPCIILIASRQELEKFSVPLSLEQEEKWKKFEDRPTSIVLDCPDETFAYLHRGTGTLAFRLPASEEFRGLLKKTGPLIAPSANPEGLPPAKNIKEAKGYFGSAVDLYVDGGEISGVASRVVRLLADGSTEILRA